MVNTIDINPKNVNTNDVHNGMSNFEVRIARNRGVQIEVFHDKCNWGSDEVIKRILAARKGEEWLYNECPNIIK